MENPATSYAIPRPERVARLTPLPVVERLRVFVPESAPSEPPREARCVVPGCPRSAGQRHHIVNRSITNGPVDFVLIKKLNSPGYWLVKIVADVCRDHHDSVESKVGGVNCRIRFLEESGWGYYRRANWDIDQSREGIWWHDSKTKSAWEFRGFLRGEWIVESRNSKS